MEVAQEKLEVYKVHKVCKVRKFTNLLRIQADKKADKFFQT